MNVSSETIERTRRNWCLKTLCACMYRHVRVYQRIQRASNDPRWYAITTETRCFRAVGDCFVLHDSMNNDRKTQVRINNTQTTASLFLSLFLSFRCGSVKPIPHTTRLSCVQQKRAQAQEKKPDRESVIVERLSSEAMQ